MRTNGYIPFHSFINGAKYIGNTVKAGIKNFLDARTPAEVARDNAIKELHAIRKELKLLKVS